eukprot:CAMPEP_0115178340 /NCGR_PEP_ID=MMETSP0270-20121206/5851_1 /TAXON_ID=71861 /ORGANISM="Scrippsiella trochoidea, Strain CCMP3099" /LENGTH=111 /DNA_ID=CAMNT_0002591301 /DNA_START=277 /DNA_END=608 /DNA_ORIENTATION=-
MSASQSAWCAMRAPSGTAPANCHSQTFAKVEVGDAATCEGEGTIARDLATASGLQAKSYINGSSNGSVALVPGPHNNTVDEVPLMQTAAAEPRSGTPARTSRSAARHSGGP